MVGGHAAHMFPQMLPTDCIPQSMQFISEHTEASAPRWHVLHSRGQPAATEAMPQNMQSNASQLSGSSTVVVKVDDVVLNVVSVVVLLKVLVDVREVVAAVVVAGGAGGGSGGGGGSVAREMAVPALVVAADVGNVVVRMQVPQSTGQIACTCFLNSALGCSQYIESLPHSAGLKIDCNSLKLLLTCLR